MLRDEYDNVKQWITEVINQVLALLSDREYGVFQSKYKIFPPALFTNAPLGGKMQKEVHETYARIMAKKERYTKMEPKNLSNAWQKRTPIFFDATPESFPTLPKQKKTPGKNNNEEVNSIESTVKTTMTKTAHTTMSNDIDTIVSKIDTVVSHTPKYLKNSCRTRKNNKPRTENDLKTTAELARLNLKNMKNVVRQIERRMNSNGLMNDKFWNGTEPMRNANPIFSLTVCCKNTRCNRPRYLNLLLLSW